MAARRLQWQGLWRARRGLLRVEGGDILLRAISQRLEKIEGKLDDQQHVLLLLHLRVAVPPPEDRVLVDFVCFLRF